MIKEERILYDTLEKGNEVMVKVITHRMLHGKEYYRDIDIGKAIIQSYTKGDKYIRVQFIDTGWVVFVEWIEGELIFEQNKEIPTVREY